MVKLFVLLALATSTACSPTPFVQAKNLSKSPVIKTTMPSATDKTIKSITLVAREEKRSPVGVSDQANRDIGFASVFLRLENPKQVDEKLIIQKIEIRKISDGKIQIASQSPQEIYLRPLENSEKVFHLVNKIGYSGKGKVKAIITYQLGNKTYAIESPPVEVN
jgi:dissimilatory sulfite reductase (desulfoviridin) alpha/beta subunit